MIASRIQNLESTSGNCAGLKLAFVVSEDWFFVSHFMPMARAARALGFEIIVFCRVQGHRELIERAGMRVIPFDLARQTVNPATVIHKVWQLTEYLRRENPDLLHCIALRGVLIGGMAANLAKVRRRIYAFTGFGFLGAQSGFAALCAKLAIRIIVRGLLESRQTQFLFENPDDPKSLGLDPQQDKHVTIVPGAGVDPQVYSEMPLPVGPPLKVAVVSRMLWSKGVDLAVEAVALAQSAGARVELSLFGEPDHANPKAISEETLRDWGAKEGIRWHGVSNDVVAIWREHHVCLLASRGGEGLPRTMLEAASCGRPIVASDTPGCRYFVRHGVEGFLFPKGDPQMIANALIRLAADGGLVGKMGEAAAQRVRIDFTEHHVAERVKQLYLTFFSLRLET